MGDFEPLAHGNRVILPKAYKMKPTKTHLFILSFFSLWTLAWVIHNFLASSFLPALKTTPNVDLLYWAIAKILVWVVFPYYYVQQVLRAANPKHFLGLQNVKTGILFGLLASLIWVTCSFLLNPGALSFSFSLTWLWVFTGTPICEEFTFRGVILPCLQQNGTKFWLANLATSALFVLIHCVGWSFQGVLTTNLLSITAVSIFVFSLAAGWLRYKTASLSGSIVLHALNNLFASLR
jgi:uncharacterized protein